MEALRALAPAAQAGSAPAAGTARRAGLGAHQLRGLKQQLTTTGAGRLARPAASRNTTVRPCPWAAAAASAGVSVRCAGWALLALETYSEKADDARASRWPSRHRHARARARRFRTSAAGATRKLTRRFAVSSPTHEDAPWCVLRTLAHATARWRTPAGAGARQRALPARDARRRARRAHGSRARPWCSEGAEYPRPAGRTAARTRAPRLTPPAPRRCRCASCTSSWRRSTSRRCPPPCAT